VKKVFLSGPQGSHEELSLLADALTAEEMEVWRTDWMVPGTGSDWTEEVLSAIKRCDVFVAVLHKTNPNVMFELGYALGGGKCVLLIRKRGGEIPFDVASLPAMFTDSFDPWSISQAVEWIKRATIRSRAAAHDFQSEHDRLRRMCEDESFLDEIEPRAFEECIAMVLQEKGFEAHLLSARNNKGFDIEINDFLPNTTAVIEVKKQNRNSRLSVTEVQRVLGAAVAARAHCAMMVTAGGFTASAKFFAEESPIHVELLTIDELVDLTRDGLIERYT
jgi:nucleoside 2-deoxyribosyltransferase